MKIQFANRPVAQAPQFGWRRTGIVQDDRLPAGHVRWQGPATNGVNLRGRAASALRLLAIAVPPSLAPTVMELSKVVSGETGAKLQQADA